jgi:hypothetical protein
VMISLNSANALTTATVTPEMKPSDIVNNGMPDRVRLYGTSNKVVAHSLVALGCARRIRFWSMLTREFFAPCHNR